MRPGGLTREVETPLASNHPRMRPSGAYPYTFCNQHPLRHSLCHGAGVHRVPQRRARQHAAHPAGGARRQAHAAGQLHHGRDHGAAPTQRTHAIELWVDGEGSFFGSRRCCMCGTRTLCCPRGRASCKWWPACASPTRASSSHPNRRSRCGAPRQRLNQQGGFEIRCTTTQTLP
jgi:hypothetical protein